MTKSVKKKKSKFFVLLFPKINFISIYRRYGESNSHLNLEDYESGAISDSHLHLIIRLIFIIAYNC